MIFVIKLLNSRTWLTHKNSVAIFLASDTYAPSLTLAASETSMASTTLKIIFHQKKLPDLDDFIPPYQNDQFWSLFVYLIIKNPNFYWYLAIFLSEVVVASKHARLSQYKRILACLVARQCYFFGKRLIKLKYPKLRSIYVGHCTWDFKV